MTDKLTLDGLKKKVTDGETDGDYVLKPDLETLRPVSWLKGTAMVLCDLLDHRTIAKHASKEIAWQQGHSARPRI